MIINIKKGIRRRMSLTDILQWFIVVILILIFFLYKGDDKHSFSTMFASIGFLIRYIMNRRNNEKRIESIKIESDIVHFTYIKKDELQMSIANKNIILKISIDNYVLVSKLNDEIIGRINRRDISSVEFDLLKKSLVNA
jgi:hypothetical protein